jgi:hypothetical protein
MAKQKLALPFAMLGMKPLIRITLRSSPHGGKPCHHITLVGIWPENERFFKPPPSPDEQADEVATSPDDLATSADETKKTPLRTTKEEKGTLSNPSSREDERDPPQEEISDLWRFVCTLFNRPSERSPTPTDIKLMKQLLPVPRDEYELVEWWYGLSERDHGYKEGAGFHLRRRPTSVRNLLKNWSSLNDVARGFRHRFEERGFLY